MAVAAVSLQQLNRGYKAAVKASGVQSKVGVTGQSAAKLSKPFSEVPKKVGRASREEKVMTH